MALGGSINDTNPKIRNPESGKLIGCVVNWNPGGYLLGGSLKSKVPILIHAGASLAFQSMGSATIHDVKKTDDI